MNNVSAPVSGGARGRWEWVWVYGACAVLVLGFVFFVGPVAFVDDSFYLCDPVKYLLGHSLPGGANLFFFYRPLISILWLPAHFLSRPESVALAIQFTNALIYALGVWPLLLLLREYANLSVRMSRWAAFLLALSPCVIIYAPMLMTEAIYVPIFLVLVLVVWRRTQHSHFGLDAICGLLLGLCYLSRHAGSIVPVAWAIAEVSRLVEPRIAVETRLVRLRGAVITGLVAMLPIGGWMVISRYVAEGAGGASASLFSELAGGHEYAVAWALNLLQYLCWTPAGFIVLAGVLALLVCPMRLVRDPVAIFVLGTVMLAVLSTVIFQSSHWGDRSLCLNRYVAPYVIPLTLVAWRYVQHCSGRIFATTGVIYCLSWAIGFPEALNTHFVDYLSWAKLLPKDIFWSELLIRMSFALSVLLGLLCCWWKWRVALMIGLTAFTFIWDVGAAMVWRNYSVAMVRPSLEGADSVWNATVRDRVPVVVEAQHSMAREIVLFRCFYPDQLPRKDIESLPSLLAGHSPLRLVTLNRFSLGKAIITGTPVWEFPQIQTKNLSLAWVKPFEDSEIAFFKIAGQREASLSVSDKISVEIECVEALQAELRLRVISPQRERKIQVTGNSVEGGNFMTLVPSGTLKGGWREVRIPLHLQTGKNFLLLEPLGPMVTLGKRQLRLIVSNVADVGPLEIDASPSGNDNQP